MSDPLGAYAQERLAAQRAVLKAIISANPDAQVIEMGQLHVYYDEQDPEAPDTEWDIPSIERNDAFVVVCDKASGGVVIPQTVIMSWRQALRLLIDAGKLPADTVPGKKQMMTATQWREHVRKEIAALGP